MKHELSIRGMTGLSCAAHMVAALSDMPGVPAVKVESASKRALVEHAGEVNPEAFSAEVRQAGYAVSYVLHLAESAGPEDQGGGPSGNVRPGSEEKLCQRLFKP